jgi:hypothetical protein
MKAVMVTALVVIPKVWNHLCLISFTYSAVKLTGTFSIKHSMKFLLPLRTISGTHIMDTVSFKLCRLMKRIRCVNIWKSWVVKGIFRFLHITMYVTTLSISSSYKGIVFWLYLYFVHLDGPQLPDFPFCFSNTVFKLPTDIHDLAELVPHYDNKDNYSFSFIITMPILFPSLCPAEALIICIKTKNSL